MTDNLPPLLPCPFCESSRLCTTINDHDSIFVECEDCGYSGPSEENEAEAIDAWNRRAALAHPAASPQPQPVQPSDADGWVLQEVRFDDAGIPFQVRDPVAQAKPEQAAQPLMGEQELAAYVQKNHPKLALIFRHLKYEHTDYAARRRQMIESSELRSAAPQPKD